MRRLLDIVLSVGALIAASPILIAIGCAIYAETGGPIFFTQMRVGRNGRPFRIWKFRSMVALLNGPALTAAGDPRITRVGAFLRHTKLDELPQLWNVLRGEMAIVGPRPELPQFVDRFPERYRTLLRVRPGLVDPASLAFADEERRLAAHAEPVSFYVAQILPAKLALSARYLATRTAGSDLRLILRTIALSGKRLFGA